MDTRMDAQWKTKWLEALRSGQYQQGKGYLRRGDRYCCLGVLCDLVPRTQWQRSGVDMYSVATDRDSSDAASKLLPLYVEQETRLRADTWHLMEMNDTGKSFSEIAEWIEEHL